MDSQVLHRAKELRAQGKKWDEVGAALGYPHENIRKAISRQEGDMPIPKITIGDSTPDIDSIIENSGLDPSEWTIRRASITENGRSRVWVDRLGPDLCSWKKQMLEDVADVMSHAEIRMNNIEYYPVTDPHMLEMSLFDIHMGKLAWGEETLDNYDSSIARERFEDALLDLALRATAAVEVDQILFPVGNDLLHVDTPVSTTRLGTYQDTDSRYLKMFRVSHRLMTWAINVLREIAPVVVPIIPGNHDRVGAFMLGEVLEAQFTHDDCVTINNSANIRKYHRYGTNLIGLTHGNEEPHSQLPLTMADEAKKDWSETTFHEWHIGHIHNKQQAKFLSHDQFRTTGIRIIPSLCSNDYWHYMKGYRHLPQGEAHLWSHGRGYQAMFTHTTPGKDW